MSEWDRLIADLHATEEDTARAVAACEALDKAADASWLPQLYQLLATGRDSFVREAAAAPIARLEGSRALPQLVHALELGKAQGHDNDGLNSVIVAVIEANPEEAAIALRQLLQGQSEYQRAAAVDLLGFAEGSKGEIEDTQAEQGAPADRPRDHGSSEFTLPPA
jgi:HEAT repeat protein